MLLSIYGYFNRLDCAKPPGEVAKEWRIGGSNIRQEYEAQQRLQEVVTEWEYVTSAQTSKNEL